MERVKPLAADLCCGVGGWTEGLQAEGWDVIGWDIEIHEYGEHKYPGQLVIQDILSLAGHQLRDFGLIVASPPCTFFSYTAMPWSRAKRLAAEVRADPARLEKELALFNACFRIQRETCEAAGRYIPLVVENVRGAIPWVGRSRWNFGSFHLWGDVPALMPAAYGRMKAAVTHRSNDAPFLDFRTTGRKVPGFRSDGRGGSFQTTSVEGVKCGGDWFNADQPSISRLTSSKSPARKAASAMIAKIPAPLAQYVAKVYYPCHGQ